MTRVRLLRAEISRRVFPVRRSGRRVTVFLFLPQGKRKKRKREKLQDSGAGKLPSALT